MDNVTGTAGNDTILGAVDNNNAELNTMSALDAVNGGAGTDTLRISFNHDKTAAVALPTVTNVEVIELQAIQAVTLNTTTVTGVTDLNATKATGTLGLTAATSTNITTSNTADTITIDGGKNITVTDATADKAITIGDTTVNAGTITVTDTKVGAADITVDGGTDVTITATGSSGGANTISIGQGKAATDLPTGTVTVSSAHTATAGTDVKLSAIKVSGGSTVSVTQTADTSKAAADTTGATLTQGVVTIVAGDATTSVTVNQAASVAAVKAVTAVAGKTETASVKFAALAKGESIIVGGDGDTTLEANELQFTATVAMTAAEVAQAFANLTNGTLPVAGDTQGSGVASKGVYTTSGTNSALTGWTSGAASGDTVVFTSTTASKDVTDLAVKSTGTAATVTTTAGSDATAAKTGVLGVIAGTVAIDDNATASVTTVTLNGYDDATLGKGTALSKITDLSLTNSGGTAAGDTDATVDLYAGAVTSLNLSLNNVQGAVDVDKTAATITSLNVATAGAASKFALTADAVETLTVKGSSSANFTGDLKALKTVTVSETAGLTLAAAAADTITSINTSATTGAVTATIDGTKATYTGGAGVDTLSLATGTALTKAIDLGAGDDTLVFVADVTGSTATLSGGDGTDTLSMSTARAAALDATKQTFYTGFERLTINDAAGSEDINLSNLGFTNYVTTTGSTGTLTLSNLASNGTVVITTAPTTGYTVNVTDAKDGKADVLNLITSSAGGVAAGTVTAANVETVNISVVDTDTKAGTNTDTMTLVATAATKLAISGTGNFTLTNTGNTKVAEIDASTLTGGLTAQAAGSTATVIKGGLGNDVLTASVSSVGTDNATGSKAVIVADGSAAGSTDGVDAVTEIQTLTITADATDNNDETLTVTFGTNGSGGTGSVEIDLKSVDVTKADDIATAVATALNSNGAFSTVASAKATTDTVTITYLTSAINYTEVTAVAGGTKAELAGTGATTKNGAPAIAEVTTVTLTDGTNNGLSAGDTMSLKVAGTTYTYTAAGTVTMDTAAAGLATLIAKDAKVASATYDATANVMTITAATAGATGLSVGTYAITDANDVTAVADELIGGAGNDKLIGNAAMTKMTGGEGSDMFVIGTASLNVNSYNTITDFQSGDLIQFSGADSFQASAVTLGATAVFQDYANAAMNAVGANDLAWFQYGGDTYILMDVATTNSTTFINGEDMIVKLTGLIDLSNASFNATHGTIALV